MTISIFRNTLLTALFLSGSCTTLAEETLLIETQGDDLNTQKMGLSHLAVGESEIIYTENGKELTITRTEDGMELLVDGEKTEQDPQMAEAKCSFEVIIETDCDDCGMKSEDMLILTEIDPEDMGCPHSVGDINTNDGEAHMIMIRKEVIETTDKD